MKGSLAITNNELIMKRRRKRIIKRTIMLAILLSAVLVTLCLKLSYFNISTVKVINNNIVNSDEIINLSKVNTGTNIFYADIKNIKTNVLKNPYLLKADIKRKLPDTIIISITEREAFFYSKHDNKFLIIDRNGVVLEEKDDISNMNLTSLEGIDLTEAKIGHSIPGENKRKIESIGLLSDLIALNSSGIDITSVNLSDELNLVVNCKDITVKLGVDDIKNKLNQAFNIIANNGLKEQKGYIDVSFQGNPVVFIEK